PVPSQLVIRDGQRVHSLAGGGDQVELPFRRHLGAEYLEGRRQLGIERRRRANRQLLGHGRRRHDRHGGSRFVSTDRKYGWRDLGGSFPCARTTGEDGGDRSQSDGVRLYVEEQGPPDAGLTVVFVHGFCMTADAWAFQRRDLADLGRTLCYDQRAHGRSGPCREWPWVCATSRHCVPSPRR